MATFHKILFVTLVFAVSNTLGSKYNHYASYGKPCTNDSTSEPTLARCNLDINMYCSENAICECIIGERSRVFSYYDKACIQVSSIENNYDCDKDIQCQLSSYGKYSRCNMDYDQCECFDRNEKTLLVDRVCFIQSPPQFLKSARGFQGCSSDDACKESKLGNLSRCNMVESMCECYDTITGKHETVDYNGRCIYKKAINAFCKEDDECRAGYHKNAVCDLHPSYLQGERVCQCPKDKKCDGGSGAYSSLQVKTQSLVMIGFTTVMMGLVASVIG